MRSGNVLQTRFGNLCLLGLLIQYGSEFGNLLLIEADWTHGKIVLAPFGKFLILENYFVRWGMLLVLHNNTFLE